MESWNAEGLGVRQSKDKVVAVAKSDVAQVAMVGGLTRQRKAAYAGLVAGGITAGLLVVACASAGGCDVNPAALAAGGAIWVGGIAAGVAALFPQHKEVIYQAQRAPSARDASNE
jgi:hypothetical protein